MCIRYRFFCKISKCEKLPSEQTVGIQPNIHWDLEHCGCHDLVYQPSSSSRQHQNQHCARSWPRHRYIHHCRAGKKTATIKATKDVPKKQQHSCAHTSKTHSLYWLYLACYLGKEPLLLVFVSIPDKLVNAEIGMRSIAQSNGSTGPR